MTVFRLALLISLAALTAAGRQNPPQRRPASCPVTRPAAVPFTPPGERKLGKNDDIFWLGTEKLWVALPKSGEVWGWLPRGPGEPVLTAKIFWGSVEFDYHREEDYDLKV